MPDVLDNSASVLAATPDSPPPAPDLGGQLNSRQAPPSAAPQGPPSVDPAVVANVAHHATFGAAVKSMLGSLHGTQTAYKTNPQTGQIEETTVPTRPGKFFRDLLAGALIGGAASGGGEGGFLGGAARGGTAVIQDQRQQSQQAYDRARQAQSDSLETRKADDEHRLHLATIAHTNLQIAAAQQQLHNLSEEQLAKKNEAAKAYETFVKDTPGAQPVKFTLDGQSVDGMSAPDFQSAFVKDPSILHSSSDDYVRHFVDVNDATELHSAGQGNWVDDAGNPVRLADNTVIRAYDIPSRSLKTSRMVPGSEILKVRPELKGTIDPTRNYSVSPEAMSSLYTLELKDHATNARASAENALANERATKGARASANDARLISEIESKRATAFERASRDYQKAISLGTDATEAQSVRDQARGDAQTAYDRSMAALKGQSSQSKSNTSARVQPPQGKAVVYDPQNTPHFVDSDKLKSFLADPQYKGWHQ